MEFIPIIIGVLFQKKINNEKKEEINIINNENFFNNDYINKKKQNNEEEKKILNLKKELNLNDIHEIDNKTFDKYGLNNFYENLKKNKTDIENFNDDNQQQKPLEENELILNPFIKDKGLKHEKPNTTLLNLFTGDK